MPPKPQPEDIAGGQALIEGVMMRHGDKIAAAVRRPDNEIVFLEHEYVPLTTRYKVLGWMFIRGTITLFEMMIVGFKALMFSADVALSEEERKPKDWEMYLSLMISFSLDFFWCPHMLHKEFHNRTRFTIRSVRLEYLCFWPPLAEKDIVLSLHAPNTKRSLGNGQPS